MQEISHAFLMALSLIAAFDPELVRIVILSLSVSLSATVIGLAIGAPLGAALAINDFRGKQVVVVFVNALLGLPPVVVGLLVYLLLSRSGPLGFFGILFTPAAMVIAQSILTTPIVIALVHRGTTTLWLEHGDILRTDGASLYRCIRELFIIGRAGLLTAFLAAFGRAIAEVGAIIVVGGNILGFTRTMTTAIALETSKGDLAIALSLGFILIMLSVAVSTVAFWLNQKL